MIFVVGKYYICLCHTIGDTTQQLTHHFKLNIRQELIGSKLLSFPSLYNNEYFMCKLTDQPTGIFISICLNSCHE